MHLFEHSFHSRITGPENMARHSWHQSGKIPGAQPNECMSLAAAPPPFWSVARSPDFHPADSCSQVCSNIIDSLLCPQPFDWNTVELTDSGGQLGNIEGKWPEQAVNKVEKALANQLDSLGVLTMGQDPVTQKELFAYYIYARSCGIIHTWKNDKYAK